MERDQLQTKFRGALLGVAVGDALGAPFEGRRTIIRTALDRLIHDPGSMRYTDDLQELADALLPIATRARGDRGAGGDQTAGPCH